MTPLVNTTQLESIPMPAIVNTTQLESIPMHLSQDQGNVALECNGIY